MKASEILMDEHRVILSVLDSLEAMAGHCEAGGALDAAFARAAAEFFREFADRCHHAKEENYLFPMLEAAGLPRQGGPTGVMLHEHEEGRAQVRGMCEEIDAAASGDTQARRRYLAHARGYIALLREHIGKEDHCLFPIAERALSAANRAALDEAFQRVDDEEIGRDTLAKYRRLAGELAEKAAQF